MPHVEAERFGCAECVADFLGLGFAAIATIPQAADGTKWQMMAHVSVRGGLCRTYYHLSSPIAPSIMSCIAKPRNACGLANSSCHDVSKKKPGRSRAWNPPWATPCSFCHVQHTSSKLGETMARWCHPRATASRAHPSLLLMQNTI